MGTNLENGAVLVITDKQYVLTYNQGFGASAHNPAFARVYKEIHGGGIIEDFKEMHTLNGKCKKQFIFARIVFEKGKGGLYFENLSKSVVNHMNYQQFIKFYEEHNEEIKKISEENPGFEVSFRYENEEGKKITSKTKDLDALKEYLESRVKNITEDIPTSSEDEVVLSEKLDLSDSKIKKEPEKPKTKSEEIKAKIDYYQQFLKSHDLSNLEDQQLKKNMEEKINYLSEMYTKTKEREIILFQTESLLDNIVEEYKNSELSSYDKTKQFVERFSTLKGRFMLNATMTEGFKKTDRYNDIIELFSKYPDLKPFKQDSNVGKVLNKINERKYYASLLSIIEESIQKKGKKPMV